MSHNASPTVNNTVNITIYNNTVNAQLAQLGLQPVPVGDPVPVITQKALAQMLTLLTTKFNATFPSNPLPASNTDGGYMGPLSSVQPGVPPACAVTQITDDFNNWGISLTNLPNTLANQVAQEIVSQGGQAGFSSGTHQVTTSESIYWMVGYLTINITQTEQGILYVFAASEGINIALTSAKK